MATFPENKSEGITAEEKKVANAIVERLKKEQSKEDVLDRGENKPIEITFKYKGPEVRKGSLKDASVDNVGMFLLSDLHIGTLLPNFDDTYAWRKERLTNVVNNLLHVIRYHYPVKTLYLALLGDIIQGQENYRQQVTESDHESKQVIAAVKMVAEAVIALIDGCYSMGTEVKVVEVAGNHGKTSPLRSRTRDNHEMTIYAWLNDILLGRYPKLEIESDINFVYKEIEGLNMLFEHGDATRMYGQLPYYGIGRRADKMRGTLGKKTGKFIDVYNIGHFHSFNQLTVNGITVFMTGTLHEDSDFSYTLGLTPDTKFWFYTVHNGQIGAQFGIYSNRLEHKEVEVKAFSLPHAYKEKKEHLLSSKREREVSNVPKAVKYRAEEGAQVWATLAKETH